MQIKTDKNSVEMTLQESGKEELYLGVRVAANHFSAQKDSVGIARRDFEAFVRLLAQLEEQRRGDIILSSMRSGEFELQIKSAGSRGEMVVQGQISRTLYQAESALVNTLQFAFVYDPLLLRAVVREAEQLLKDAAS